MARLLSFNCLSPARGAANRRSVPRKDTPFLNKMRELERVSPQYADVIGGIVDAIFVQVFGARDPKGGA